MNHCRSTLRKNINTNEEGVLPLQITTEFIQYICIHTHQFAADNVMSNMTLKLNTCSSDNVKNCGLCFITNPPLSRI